MKQVYMSLCFILITGYNHLAAQCDFTPNVIPKNLVLCPGTDDTLRTTELYDSYQWYKGNKLLEGETRPFLVVRAESTPAFFKVEVTKNGCTEMSARVLVDGYVFLLPYYIIEGNLTYDPVKNVQIGCDNTQVRLTYSYPENVQWYNGDNPIPGANNAVYRPTKSGEYWACGAPETCPNLITCDRAFGTTIFFDKVNPVIIEKGDSLVASKGNSRQFKYESYRWFYNGRPIAGTTEPSILPTRSGAYRVAITDQYDCRGISDPYLFTKSFSAVLIKLTPNPASDMVQISWDKQIKYTLLKVTDTFGKQWHAQQLSDQYNYRFNVQQWPSGNYFITLTDTAGNKAQHLLMVQ